VPIHRDKDKDRYCMMMLFVMTFLSVDTTRQEPTYLPDMQHPNYHHNAHQLVRRASK